MAKVNKISGLTPYNVPDYSSVGCLGTIRS